MNNGNKMLKTGPRFENGGRFSLPKKPRRVRSPQAANSVPSIFRGGVYVAKNTLRGESVFSRILCVKTRGSERKLFCQKRAPPFFDKLQKIPGAVHREFFYEQCQQSFAPAGMASSSSSRCSFSSPFSLWTAEISMPQEGMPIIFRGGRFRMATAVLPMSCSGW